MLKAQQYYKPKKDNSRVTKGKCWNCSKKGHYVKDCWAKGVSQEGQVPKWFKPGNKDIAKQAQEKEFTFVSKEVPYSAISASDWLADSAAMTHIVRSQNDFASYAKELSEVKGISPSAILWTTHGTEDPSTWNSRSAPKQTWLNYVMSNMCQTYWTTLSV